jgi:hypothetical protein
MTKMISTPISAAALAAVLLGSVVLADESAPSGLRAQLIEAQLKRRFAKADTDHDGRLTRDEAHKGMSRVYEHFDEIDTEKKGYLALEQIQGFLKNRSQNQQPQPHKPPLAVAGPASGQPQP